ncbi:immunity protein Tsi6 family protein [Nitrospirillum sp. BR 11164]|uniref:immunity protein Tsi6 family protein n=1 Tax=Nitrospirillum sp. BR 11164 TaxID=3104324 RepID=UPI002AFEA979|nr:immunity protein Tsi6 family protein [Nitrospirillum sp. BR 11164]MEA1649434.1 immunity protein Tsi6 family protein [Nitrospirillum sp. BR 11164]
MRTMIQDALLRCRQLRVAWPDSATLGSIHRQLDYLLLIATDPATNRARLVDIVIGVQAAREVEAMDPDLADLLHAISAWVDRLLAR